MNRSTPPEIHYAAPSALVQGQFVDDAVIAVDDDGDIVSVAQGAAPPGAIRLKGIVVPGMPDLHSHAFQRAMAGLAEKASPAGENFWSWRDVMYRFLGRLSPEDVEAIAAQLYIELLRQGFTAIGEFHYVHNDFDGRAYADPAEMSRRIGAAARTSGIGLTLLPVLYQASGFGGKPATEGQRRFLKSSDEFIALIESLRRTYRDDPQIKIGIAPHSLRAAPAEALAECVEAITVMDPRAPIHIHSAEQDKEVEDCVAWSGERPVEWLLNHAPVDGRWCLVHCTQMTADETARLAASGAVAGICPSTEANLGDGIFPLLPYLRDQGRFGVGTDSNVVTSPADELRWLEYVQRLVTKQRNVSESSEGAHTGAGLYRRALAGGAQACGRKIGEIAPGYRADLVVLNPDHPALIGRRHDSALDSWVFSGNETPVRDVMAGGRWVVADGRHVAQDEVLESYKRCITRLTND
jgi:formimidoylglutamate deiminase